MKEHLELIKENNLPIPQKIFPVRIIVQNQSELVVA
jgi:hypothetical protein